ncbi:hypothetical protein [Deinococcus budaensis]|uniref:Uncharacterized protein n=1 Tax=Deinococcus budaensis TaxID=1665626 RepID=A0A7W8LPW4_9DEIO|nr:hypothetical protein [Deinococcus budaensis]MBB5234124.1 hypothetical protein [Deinococcus budaensis]
MPTLDWIGKQAVINHTRWLRSRTDFVALLEDGRVAIEYKGDHLLDTADTREKADIGALWTRASGGRALDILLTRANAHRLEQLMGL